MATICISRMMKTKSTREKSLYLRLPHAHITLSIPLSANIPIGIYGVWPIVYTLKCKCYFVQNPICRSQYWLLKLLLEFDGSADSVPKPCIDRVDRTEFAYTAHCSSLKAQIQFNLCVFQVLSSLTLFLRIDFWKIKATIGIETMWRSIIVFHLFFLGNLSFVIVIEAKKNQTFNERADLDASRYRSTLFFAKPHESTD